MVGLAQEMANLPELQSLTFENNSIRDEDALCALFNNLRGYERLENLNIRQNKFSYNVVNALATGITDKRELRVSETVLLLTVSILCVRLWIWVRTRSMTGVRRDLLRRYDNMFACTCFSWIIIKSQLPVPAHSPNASRINRT